MKTPTLGSIHRTIVLTARSTAAVILTLAGGVISEGIQAQDLRTVALLGDPAPGFDSPAGTFSNFSPASISETGFVVFESFITVGPGFASAIYRWDDVNGLKLVAKDGPQAISNGSVDILAFSGQEIVDDQGRVAFQALLNDTMNPSGQPAIFFWENDSLTLLVKNGDPETVDGTHFSTGDPIVVPGTFELITGRWDFAFNAGKVAFNAGLDTDPGLERGLWLADPSTTCADANQCTNLANSVQDAPGAPPPPTTPRFDTFDEVVRNPAGTTGAIISLNSGDQQFGFYRWNSANTPEFVARGNVPFVEGVLQLAMDSVGSLGFRGGFGSAAPFDADNSKAGVFANLRQVYQERITPAPGVMADPGDPAPLLAASSGHAQTNNGLSVFAARIWQTDGGPTGSLHDKYGIWRETGPGTIDLVAHEGQEVPPSAPGLSPRNISQGPPPPTFETLHLAHVNRQGQVSIWATKQGTGIDASNDEGLFAIQGNGLFEEILSKGELVLLEDFQVKTVSGFFPLGAFSQFDTAITGPGTEGRSNALNGSGDLAMVLNFADSSSGVFVIPLGALMVIEPPKLVGLEVNQVIQDWENSIALTKDKKTIVRAHLESPQDVFIAPILHGRRNAAELPGSPLVPTNTGLLVKTVPNATAVRGDLAKSPYFELPKSWADGTVELELELEGVGIDCQEVAGPSPNDCKTTVSFNPVDELEIQFVKVHHTEGGSTHEPTDQLIADLAERLKAIYPIADLDSSPPIRYPLSEEGQPSSCELGRKMRRLRRDRGCTDAAGCKRIYYAVVARESVSGCAPGTSTGDNSVAAAGYHRADPKKSGRTTAPHELGHLLGRPHSTKESFGSTSDLKLGACCSVSGKTDPDFANYQNVGAASGTCTRLGITPNDNGERAALGPLSDGDDKLVFGLDLNLKEAVDPNKVFDLMGYCRQQPVQRWPSNITYEAIRQKINDTFDPAGVAPGGTPLDYLQISGTFRFDPATLEFLPLALIPDLVSPDNPGPGDHILRLRDSGGGVLSEISFEPINFLETEGDHPNEEIFDILVPFDPSIRQIEVEHQSQILGMISASPNPPTVQVISPNGGENLTQNDVVIQWDGNDLDGDPLLYTVKYSPDGGTTWSPVATNWNLETLTVSRSELPATTQGSFRVQVSDGFDIATDESDGLFSVANNPPVVVITSPRVSPAFTGEQLVFFDAMAFDSEDGTIPEASIQWSSDLDGFIATDNDFSMSASNFAAGIHTITATATDSDGAQGSSTARIYVDFEGVIFVEGFESGFSAFSATEP